MVPAEPIAIRLAFAAAFVVLAFEVLAHRQLLFVSDGLQASMILAIAICGIGVGALLAFYSRTLSRDRVQEAAAVALGLSVLLNVLAFPLLGPALATAAPLLILPFVAAGTLIAISFSSGSVPRVYFYDLLGAACGAACVAMLLPLVAEEGAHGLVAAAALLTPALLPTWTRLIKVSLLLGGVCCIWVPINAGFGTYNLARDTQSWGEVHARKVFQVVKAKPDARVLFSRSDIGGRTDIIEYPSPAGDRARVKVYENGNGTDTLRPEGVAHYRWDPRIAPVEVLGPNASTFIIGTSGEGVMKSARALGGPVYGAEINRSVWSLVSGPAAALCGDCYDEVEVTLGEGRSVLAKSGRSFDQITLMNAHIARGTVGSRSADPEFIHTQQAIALYLEHLTPTGVITWEEPARSNLSHRVTARLASTAIAALTAQGAADPTQHIVAFQWTGASSYDQLLVRKSPWTEEALAAVRHWLDQVEALTRYQPGHGPIRAEIELLWMPDQRDLPGNLAALLRGDPLPPDWRRRVPVPITDERPFPFDVRTDHQALVEALAWVVGASGALVGLPLLLILFRFRTESTQLVAPLAAAAVLGVAYLMIQVVLMQQLLMLLHSPSTTFLVVLVGMLGFSGLGGLVGGRSNSPIWRGAVVILPFWMVFQGWLVPAAMDGATLVPGWMRVVLATGIVAPTAFCMGMPLPVTLDLAKARAGDEFAAVLYALNAALSAIGAFAALHVAMTCGFPAVYAVGAVLYALTAVLLLWAHQSAGR